MRNHVLRTIIGIFFLGLCTNFVSQLICYQQYTDPIRFRLRTASEKRGVIGWLVQRTSFKNVTQLLRAAYPREEPISHGVGHLLGEEAYKRFGEKAFAMCDPIFNYGCYHGVIDMAIRLHGPSTALVHHLKIACDQYMSDASSCVHPLGHASTVVTQYEVVSAFALCDQLYPNSNVAFSCWNGAMMEFINRSAPNAPVSEYGDKENPYYPCNSVPLKYQASCVSMHMSYLASIWNHHVIRMVHFCRTYERVDTVTHCIDAVGSLIGQDYFDTSVQIPTVCLASEAYVSTCIMGAIVPFLAARDIPTAQYLCDSLPVKDREVCFARISLEDP